MSEFTCPKCKGPLRDWTYAERKAYAREVYPNETMALLLMPAMFGALPWYFCDGCQARFSTLSLANQIVTVTPLEIREQDRG